MLRSSHQHRLLLLQRQHSQTQGLQGLWLQGQQRRGQVTLDQQQQPQQQPRKPGDATKTEVREQARSEAAS